MESGACLGLEMALNTQESIHPPNSPVISITVLTVLFRTTVSRVYKVLQTATLEHCHGTNNDLVVHHATAFLEYTHKLMQNQMFTIP